MKEALLLAEKAGANGEIPVGAVIVKDGEIIATGRNRREENRSALGHAEIEAIHNACETLGSWRLDGCELYVTLEPCPMCAGAIISSRISKLTYGAFDPSMGACDSKTNMFSVPFGHKTEVWAGIDEKPCSEILTTFFKDLRKNCDGLEDEKNGSDTQQHHIKT
jgi:tRNA(adenine34) deaminase